MSVTRLLSDWHFIADRARRAGYGELVILCTPREPYRSVDIQRCIAALRANLGWPTVAELRQADGGEL